MDQIKVVAKIDFTDASTGVPRKAGEEFSMPRERGLLKAAQGFVEAYDEDGALIEQTPEQRRDVLEGERLTPGEKATLEGRVAPAPARPRRRKA